jgi:predicted lipoprotein with Yx(FWY)xxD motif
MRRLVFALVAALAGTACTGSPETPATVATELAVADSPEMGRYLTDASGRAVYALSAEAAGTCDTACAQQWPPVPGGHSRPEPKEPAIQQELVGVVERSDGTMQLTYAGLALHYRGRPEPDKPPDRYVRDQWGSWSLLFPHGARMVP